MPASSTFSTLAAYSPSGLPLWPRRSSRSPRSLAGGVRLLSMSRHPSTPLHVIDRGFAPYVLIVSISGAIWIDRKRSKSAVKVMGQAGKDMKKKGVSCRRLFSGLRPILTLRLHPRCPSSSSPRAPGQTPPSTHSSPSRRVRSTLPSRPRPPLSRSLSRTTIGYSTARRVSTAASSASGVRVWSLSPLWCSL